MTYMIVAVFEFPGATLYALLFNRDGLCWNGTVFASFDGDNATFDIALTENASRTGTYIAAVDANIPPGTYEEEIWEQAGGTPDRAADTRVGVQARYWCGGLEFPKEMLALGQGSGSVVWPYELLDPHGEPIVAAQVTGCPDQVGRYPRVAGTTDYLGRIIFRLDPGVYYMYRFKAGVDFVNPQRIVVRSP